MDVNVISAIDSAEITRSSIGEFSRDLKKYLDSAEELDPVHQELVIVLERVRNCALEGGVAFSHEITHLKIPHGNELLHILSKLGYTVDLSFGSDQERTYMNIAWRLVWE